MGWLLRFVVTLAASVAGVVGRLLLMLLFHAGRYLGPPLFQLAVHATGKWLSVLDGHLQGRLATNTGTILLVAGASWAAFGFAVAALLSLALSFWPACLNVPLLAGGFLFGVVCGAQARPQITRRRQADDDGLQLGEDTS